ncbi:MAG: Rne/Rng family ribonuclease [Desulfobulbus sp.]|jgi:ribonuclease E
MAEDNQEPKKKSPRRAPRKATTGAWWKSVVTSEQDEAPPEQAAQSTPEPVRKPSRGRSRAKPRSEKTPSGSADAEKDVEKSAAAELPPLPPDDAGATDDATLEAPSVDAGAEEIAAEGEGEESAPRPRKKRPNRRGRRRTAKSGESSSAETADEGAEATAVADEAPEESAAEEDDDEVDDDRVEDVEEAPDKPAKNVVYKLLVNAEEPEECRIALVEDGRLESFHVNTVEREATKNNIYKGRIVSVEANLQAAFVDIGTGRNGFLPFNEIHPEYYRQDVNERVAGLIAQQQWKKIKIEEVMHKGQEVLVQVVKEVTGNKGANMTTYLSLPGHCLVLMPGSDSAGISRKIVGEERRSSLREIMSEFEIPEGIGYIIRTASAEITSAGLEQDLHALLARWQEVKQRGQTMAAPALIYEEQETVLRYLRDHFFPEIQEILVDTEESLDQVNDFIAHLPPKQQQVKVRLHRGSRPIFNQYNIEEQIESIFRPQVPLPSGGSIVIDPTEALVAIDVNSGRTSKNSDFEETIFQANMEAAVELARQLRLRDLGGLIVVDFIDMRNKKHIREVEQQVKRSMKRDKAKVDISKISRFGLMQISRQKMGAPIEKGSYLPCAHCQGRGVVRSVETLALSYLRRIQTGVTRKKVGRVECRLPLEVAQYLLNKKRVELAELEEKHNATIDIFPQVEMKPSDHQIDFLAGEPGR